MGMSASQARLISLEARQADVEYEAQQINQQRLVLSNKMNEVQERVYNMDVPTPPSKQDFMYDVYTGKDRAGKQVKVKLNGDGSISVTQQKSGTIVEKGDILKVTTGASIENSTTVDGQKVNLPANTELWQKAVDEGTYDPGDTGRTFEVTVPALKKETATCTDQNVLSALAGKGGNAGNWKLPDGVTISYDTTYKYDDGTTTKDGVKADATNGGKPEYFNFRASADLFTGYMIEDNENSYNITVDGSGPSAQSYSALCTDLLNGYSLKSGVADLSASNRTCKIKEKQYNLGELPSLAASALNEQGFKGLNWAFKDPQCTQKFTWSDAVVDEYTYQPKMGIMRYNILPKDQTDTEKSMNIGDDEQTVGGKKIMTIAEAKANWDNDPNSSWGRCLTGLIQSQGSYDTESKSRVFNEDEWRVIVTTTSTGAPTFTFCRVDDLNDGDDQVQEYVPAQGTYDADPETLEPNDPRISYDDETGHLSEIKLEDGTTIILTYGQECDEQAYEKANNKYLYMKGLYDKEQNQLNKQTSIYQRQDKMLELKLTRLDTERNALNTEIDAVKKVIQDATEGGFKTFSG